MNMSDIKQLGTTGRQILAFVRGLEKVPEACDEILRRERACEAREEQQGALQASIDRLAQQEADAQQSLHTIQAKVEASKAQLAEQEERTAARCRELDAQIVAKEQTLSALNADLERLRARHLVA